MASGWDVKLDRFQPDNAGIAEQWKSDGMQDALAELSDSLREQADEMGRMHMPTFAPSYQSGVDELRNTAVGYVTTGSSGTANPRSAQVDQHKFQTLDALNH